MAAPTRRALAAPVAPVAPGARTDQLATLLQRSVAARAINGPVLQRGLSSWIKRRFGAQPQPTPFATPAF